MKTDRLRRQIALTITAVALVCSNSRSDEGMWLVNAPPRDLLKSKYGFDVPAAWLDHIQKASVRFNSGGSGSFISEDGLVMSNHHVGADALQKLGDKDHNYIRDGFHARTLGEEKPCHDLELNVLMSVESVTDRVNAAVRPDMTPEQAFAARRAVMAEIEKESTDRTGLRSEVVTLFQGGEYHLYRSKRHTDVRLVFAPEQQIAFFGGDADNFEYPRFNLDVCFFRVYENGKPIKTPHYLRVNAAGPAENDLVFVSGHPGRTDRLLTAAEFEYLRDRQFPYTLQWLHRREVLLTSYAMRSEENARQARDDLYGAQNSRKAREGGLAGLLDPASLAARKAAEAKLKEAAAGDEKLKDAVPAWDNIAAAQKVIADNALVYRLIEGRHGFQGDLFDIARTLLRAAEERPKPNGERLREFRDSMRESLELELFSTKPIHSDYEQLLLADSLTWLAGQLGDSAPLVEKALAGRSPRQRAADLVRGTKVRDVAFRRQLYASGKSAVDQAKDPMIELARAIDDEARAVRKSIETQEEVKKQAHAQIAKARFALFGTNTYPDATFSLRLAFGVVKGFEENQKAVPCQTTFAGLYQRAAEQGNRPPFDLPSRWAKSKGKLDLGTPFNFILTADIIGGNSGSPVINRAGELVGLIFDGNIQSLVLDFYYTEDQARAVAVHPRSITEALRRVYKADQLATEVTRGKASAKASR